MSQPSETALGPVRFLPGPNKGKYPSCHSIYIDGAGVLIDPASDRRRLAELAAGPGVGQVWLSHWHEDHMTHLDLFEDAALFVHQADAPPLADIETFLDWYDMEGDYRQIWRAMMEKDFHYQPRRPAGWLEDGQVVDLGVVTVEVIAAPGHTPGHLALFFREPAVLFLADYDLTPFGPWYGDRHSSIAQTEDSVRRLRQLPAQAWVACHGQGLFTTQPGRLWDDYLAVIERRRQALRELLTKPRTIDEVVAARIVYQQAKMPKEFIDFGEKAIMGKHLGELLATGEAVFENNAYRLS